MFLKSLLQTSALLPLFLTATSAETACNNSPSLCSRAYNNITQLGCHNSPFLRNQNTSFSTSGNQYYDTATQLDAGVRLVTGQVHKTSGSGADKWHMCHSSCALMDAGTLQSWLSSIKTWMDSNPNDVVTVLLVNSDDASASDLGSQFSATGIDKLAYSPPSLTSRPDTWPTLDKLIGNNTRLMTFVASLSESSTDYPYLMDEFTFIFENNYENSSPSNFSCDPNRPTSLGSTSAAASSGRMFLQNHFLYESSSFIQSPNASYVNVTNAQTGTGSLGSAISTCAGVYKKAANFVLVDFFNVGPAIASVDTANGVTSAQGRKSVSTAALTESTSLASGQRGSLVAVVVGVMAAVALGM